MIKYEEMSDFEVNTAVVKALRLPFKSEFCNVFLDHGFDEGACVYTRVDYCNNPNDAWPIIVDNEISLVKDKEVDWWSARSGVVEWSYESMGHDFYFDDDNPLRAAMIVFLMMKEAE